jgi:hypothetical protein
MFVRRTALIIAMFAIIASGIGAVQADAAPTSQGQTVAGEHCVTVRSNDPGHIGTICVYLARQSGKERGVVTFTSRSGRLRAVSVKVLVLSVNGKVVEVVHNASQSGPKLNGAIPLSWWDEPARILSNVVGVNDACMTWTNGGKACTGAGWLYSYPVG